MAVAAAAACLNVKGRIARKGTQELNATTQKKKAVVTDRCYCYYFTEGGSSRSESEGISLVR